MSVIESDTHQLLSFNDADQPAPQDNGMCQLGPVTRWVRVGGYLYDNQQIGLRYIAHITGGTIEKPAPKQSSPHQDTNAPQAERELNDTIYRATSRRLTRKGWEYYQDDNANTASMHDAGSIGEKFLRNKLGSDIQAPGLKSLPRLIRKLKKVISEITPKE